MITAHVLDASLGQPAGGIAIVLEIHRTGEWVRLSSGLTDETGQLVVIAESVSIGPGVCRLTFDTGSYHRGREVRPFFPEVQVVFTVVDPSKRVHISLLISPYAYSVYRGL
jgi:5-hydroxyisourate hydrolase